jgi:hypothetical protein
MGLLRRHPEPQRQHRRGPVQRLHPGLLIDAEHDGLVRRVEVEPDNLTDLGFELRIGGDLNICTRQGYRPHFFHVVDTVKSLTPRCFASNRLDQWVTANSAGGGSSVASTIST